MEGSIFQARKRLVVIGDIHGDLGRVTRLLMGMKLINDHFQWVAEPKDTWVVQMGDQLDSKVRGPDGTGSDWETTADVQVVFFMRNIDREARRHGGRVISLLGNHEILNVLGDMSYVSTHSMNLLGGPTNRALTFQPGAFMAKILADRPVVIKIGSYVFCHAGILPQHINMMNGDLARVNDIMRKYLLGGQNALTPVEITLFRELFVDPDGIIWTRAALTEQYRKDVLPLVLDALQAKALVVGHNVMLNGITTTPEHNLWFVDTGMSRSFEIGLVEALEINNDGVPSPMDENPIKIFKLLQKLI